MTQELTFALQKFLDSISLKQPLLAVESKRISNLIVATVKKQNTKKSHCETELLGTTRQLQEYITTPKMPKYNDDEVIARALQEEYDREMQRRNNNNNNTQSSSSRRGPPPVVATAPSEGSVRARRATETDEEYARRLAREEERLYQFYQQRQSRNGRNSSSSRDPPPSHSGNTRQEPRVDTRHDAPAPPREAASNAGFFEVKRSDSDITPATSREGSSIFDDEEYARRIEQELHDEDLARRMQESDENRASRYVAREVAMARPPRYSFKCFCGWLISFTILACGVIAFAYFFYIQDNGSPRNWIWDPTEFADEDVSSNGLENLPLFLV